MGKVEVVERGDERMEKPFFISLEHPNKEIEKTVEEVFLILEELGSVKIPRVYASSYYKEGKYGSVEWYVKQAYNPQRQQVCFDTLWELVEKEPWQKITPHYELMILEDDLYAPGTNFVFGGTKPQVDHDGTIYQDTVSGTILSLYRVVKWYGENWRKTFKALLLHELGHLFGLPTSSSPNFIRPNDKRARSMLDYGHCNDRKCIMEQVNVVGRLSLPEKVGYLEMYNPNYFCEYDLKALRQNLQALFF